MNYVIFLLNEKIFKYFVEQSSVPGAGAGVGREQDEGAVCVNQVRGGGGSDQRCRRCAPHALGHAAFLFVFCLGAAQQVVHVLIGGSDVSSNQHKMNKMLHMINE